MSKRCCCFQVAGASTRTAALKGAATAITHPGLFTPLSNRGTLWEFLHKALNKSSKYVTRETLSSTVDRCCKVTWLYQTAAITSQFYMHRHNVCQQWDRVFTHAYGHVFWYIAEVVISTIDWLTTAHCEWICSSSPLYAKGCLFSRSTVGRSGITCGGSVNSYIGFYVTGEMHTVTTWGFTHRVSQKMLGYKSIAQF